MKPIIILTTNTEITPENDERLIKSFKDSGVVLLVIYDTNPEKWGVRIIHDESVKVTKP